MSSLIRVGLDVHKDSIVVARCEDGTTSRATLIDTLPSDYAKLKKCLAKIGPLDRLRVCYEAGPTGFGLARRLNADGIKCVVVAPSLIPQKPGCRIKTDRRDACRLAELHRSGDLTSVTIPDEHVEAMRDLERARAAAKKDERTARQRVSKFLLRNDVKWEGASTWTQAHMKWITAQSFPHEAKNLAYRSHLTALHQATARVDELTDNIAKSVETWALKPLVTALQAMRGISLVSAVVWAAEIGDFKRFAHPRALMAFLGLVPSEHSSGNKQRRGPITRTGNKHVRQIAVETAWNNRFVVRTSKIIEARRQGLSAEIRAIAEKGERRLSKRFRYLVERGKSKKEAAVAVARELVGFVWAIARAVDTPAAGSPGGRGHQAPRSLPPSPQPPSPLLCVPTKRTRKKKAA
jgi:transposase